VAWLVVGRGLGAPLWFSLPLAALAFAFLPRLLLQGEQSKAEAQFLSLFPDAIDMMVRMLRAGLPVTAAIRTIGAEAPSPVDSVFRGVADQVDIGIPLEGALTQTAVQIGLGDFRFFAVAVALQRATGGNLAATLETLADIMRKRRAMRLKARSATAEVRLSAYVLGAMPFFIIAILLVLRPNYLVPLIADPRGNIIVGIAVTLLMLAFVSMRRMMRSIDAAVGGRSR
jgi:tight adherence protein B